MKKKAEHYQGLVIEQASIIYGDQEQEGGNQQMRTIRIKAQQPIMVRQDGDDAVIIITGTWELGEFKDLISLL